MLVSCEYIIIIMIIIIIIMIMIIIVIIIIIQYCKDNYNKHALLLAFTSKNTQPKALNYIPTSWSCDKHHSHVINYIPTSWSCDKLHSNIMVM